MEEELNPSFVEHPKDHASPGSGGGGAGPLATAVKLYNQMPAALAESCARANYDFLSCKNRTECLELSMFSQADRARFEDSDRVSFVEVGGGRGWEPSLRGLQAELEKAGAFGAQKDCAGGSSGGGKHAGGRASGRSINRVAERASPSRIYPDDAMSAVLLGVLGRFTSKSTQVAKVKGD